MRLGSSCATRPGQMSQNTLSVSPVKKNKCDCMLAPFIGLLVLVVASIAMWYLTTVTTEPAKAGAVVVDDPDEGEGTPVPVVVDDPDEGEGTPVPVVVDCKLGPWVKSGDCTKACGEGKLPQTSSIEIPAEYGGKECGSLRRETEPCNTHACPVDEGEDDIMLPDVEPVDCKLGPWVKSGDCTKACGGGKLPQTSSIEIPAEYGGKECGSLRRETQPCNTHACPVDEGEDDIILPSVEPVDCKLGPWVKSGDCTKACGGGKLPQTSSIKIPAEYGGEECGSLERETEPCNTHACGSWVDPNPDLVTTMEHVLPDLGSLNNWAADHGHALESGFCGPDSRMRSNHECKIRCDDEDSTYGFRYETLDLGTYRSPRGRITPGWFYYNKETYLKTKLELGDKVCNANSKYVGNTLRDLKTWVSTHGHELGSSCNLAEEEDVRENDLCTIISCPSSKTYPLRGELRKGSDGWYHHPTNEGGETLLLKRESMCTRAY